MATHFLTAADLVIGEPKKRERRPRKPRLDRVIKEARRAGVNVAGATITDSGVSLQFGEPTPGGEALDASKVAKDRIAQLRIGRG
jgi:hypothetical protein